ncbi:MAG: hypothetical protein OXJ62_17430, partial [Spirochaetaceae bacterium]|nr:hypothetical protein [Spirochaetaceae bacterium]
MDMSDAGSAAAASSPAAPAAMMVSAGANSNAHANGNDRIKGMVISFGRTGLNQQPAMHLGSYLA